MSEVHNEQLLSLVREERVVALSLCIFLFSVNRMQSWFWMTPTLPNFLHLVLFSSLITLYNFKSHPLSSFLNLL